MCDLYCMELEVVKSWDKPGENFALNKWSLHPTLTLPSVSLKATVVASQTQLQVSSSKKRSHALKI